MRRIFADPTMPADDPAMASAMRQALAGHGLGAANADTVQRTRRVVRQQALHSRQRRSRMRTLLLACLFFSGVMAVLTVPLWNEMDELAHWLGIPDLQMHALFLAVWFLPATIAGLLLLRGAGKAQES